MFRKRVPYAMSRLRLSARPPLRAQLFEQVRCAGGMRQSIEEANRAQQ